MAEGEGISGVAIAAIFAGGILAWSGIKGYKVSLLTQDLLSGKDPRSDPRLAATQESVTAQGLFAPIGSAIGGGIGGAIASSLNPFHLISTAGTATATGTGGPGSATIIGGSSGRFGSGFAKSVLASIGAPQTAANIASIEAWARREGGGGANNPLNTTFALGGSSNFNSTGVKNYATMAEGVLATARTLQSGLYADIVAALKSGRGLCGRQFRGLHNWSAGPNGAASQGYWSVC